MSTGRTHRPEQDEGKCSLCGGCTWACPAAVFPELAKETDSLRGKIFTNRPYPGKMAEMPPCRLACPIGQDVPVYVSAISREDTQTAADTIRETNALPSVCGRVCLASCMRACTRAAMDDGVDIRGLKRFAVQVVGEANPIAVGKAAAKVAVVGSGPAGLAAAHRLLQLGMKPVVFEASEKAGGMMIDVIPPFVLPREMVANDIANLQKMGVEIRTGVKVGKDVKWNELEAEFDAVLVATGAGKAVMPSVPGSKLEGTTNAIDFCREAGDGKAAKVTGAVVVRGGSDTSLQAARTAIRLGAKEVSVVHASPVDLWPVTPEALSIAEQEGVSLLPEHRVTELKGSSKLEAVVVRPVRGTRKDGVGRVAGGALGKEKQLDATVFVEAVNRRSVPENQPNLDNIAVGLLGSLQVDKTYKLAKPGWYAAGEAATGAASVVDSMATGRLAAEAINNDLSNKREAE
ncbi:MAG: FAD-dependent oxidoreductase [Proteobacteria bacterium]|nr:FAD-dependent oxidoreductase [Pseudomonadota bacterium]